MINVIQVGHSVFRYRGGIGQWAWAVNRAAGLGVLLFLALHIVDIFIAGFGAGLFDELLFLYKGPQVRLLDVLLVFGLLYHGINGLRLTLMDFKPTTARRHLQLFYGQIVLFLAIFIPASLAMLYEFYGVVGGALITAAVLLLPLAVAAVSNYLPFGSENVGVSGGNYFDAIVRTEGSRGRPHGGFEFDMWLFMRVSGILIIVLAFLHMYLMHFMINVENITFKTIVERWTGAQGAFWRSYDLLLLFFAFTHGMNGARNVLEDYIHSPGWRAFLKISLWLSWFLLIGLGAFIIFTFTPATLP
jgi:succinate dehydrogenase cytochrome b subunit